MPRFNQKSETRDSLTFSGPSWRCLQVHDFCTEFRSWLMRHDESLKRKADGQMSKFPWDFLELQTQIWSHLLKHGKAEISENDTKADARTIEQARCQLLVPSATHRCKSRTFASNCRSWSCWQSKL